MSVLRRISGVRLAAVALALVGAVAAPSAARAAAPALPTVTISPLKGTPDASPQTQISFLGAPAADLSRIIVRGSRSGGHGGRLEAYSTGNGASFLPLRAFTPGETVTVSAVESAKGEAPRTIGTTFTVGYLYTLPPKTPSGPTGATGTTGSSGPTGATGATGPSGPPPVQSLATEPTWRPPIVNVTTPTTDPGLGDIFLTPADGGVQPGAMIVKPTGQTVWFQPAPAGEQDTDLRVQDYHGQRVLTYWQGKISYGHGVDGTGVIDNAGYHQIAQVRAGNGLTMDLHDFLLEPNGTAWITVFEPVYYNLSSVGGLAHGVIEDCLIQEIDVKTGLVMFEWHALGHIPLNRSYSPAPKWKTGVWDWFHINSIDVEADQNILISSRNTWAVYQLGHTYGEVLWTVGGKQSNFKLGPGVRFAWQHDASLIGANILTIFDNEDTPPESKSSRAIELSLNFHNRSVSLVHQYIDPSPTVLAPSQGDIQQLPNTDRFVGWGQIGIASEFSVHGALTFQLALPPLVESYRAFRFTWSSRPASPPVAVATRAAGATATQVAASWNGATGVAYWQVRAGASPKALLPVGAPVPSTGFETQMTAATGARYVAVSALGAGRRVLANSAAVAVSAPTS